MNLLSRMSGSSIPNRPVNADVGRQSLLYRSHSLATIRRQPRPCPRPAPDGGCTFPTGATGRRHEPEESRMNIRYMAVLSAAGLCAMVSHSGVADDSSDCRGLPQHAVLKSSLTKARND